MSDALGVISACDPHRTARIAGDVRGVVVGWVSGADGSYDAATNLVALDFDFVSRDGATPEQLALVIVHEATHARIERAGIRYEAEWRAHIERTCERAELRLAERLPEPHRAWYVGHLRESLKAPAQDYSDEAFVEARMAAAHAAGMPEWLVRWARKRALRRLRVRRSRVRDERAG